MLNLYKKVKFSNKQKKYIKSLGILRYEDWDSREKINKEIKGNIKNQLLKFQNNKCVYCGLVLEETSRPEIEHIAPRTKHPNFAYTTTNLAMACQYCNSSSKKGSKETISVKKSFYNQCEFYIVHPYYDDVDKFFEEQGAFIHIRSGLSEMEMGKAQRTRDMFGLMDTQHVEARQKQLLYERFMSQYTIDERNEILIKGISTYI